MIKRREQLFPARMQRAQRTGHTKGKNMKEKWDSSQKLLIFSMVLAGATLVFVLIKLILEPRPNIFLIVFVILLCLMFPAGVYHIIFETNYLSPGHGHNHGRHDYDHNSVYEPDYEPVNERRIRERLDREMKKSRSGMPAEQLAFARSAAAAAGYIEGSEQMSPGFRNAIWKELNALAGGNAILENELWVIFRHGGSDWHRTCSFAGGRDKLRAFFSSITEIILGDNKVSDTERARFAEVAQHFGLSADEAIDLLLDSARFRRYWDMGDTEAVSSAKNYEDALMILGVSESASDREIKEAYLRLAQRYHPDKARSRGLSEDVIASCARKFEAVTDAWNIVRARCGI